MNKFKDGKLLAIVATVVVAILILITGRDSAPVPEEKVDVVVAAEEIKEPLKAESFKEEPQTEVADLKDEANTEEVTEIEVPEVKDSQALINSAVESVNVVAPKGPFSNSDATENKVDENAPVEAVSEEKEVLASDEKPNESVKVESNKLMTESAQNEESNLNIQPIWLDQKLGDFKSIEKSDTTITLVPITEDGLQGTNPAKVVTTNDDKFAPMSALGDYNYQQMPMYNGGYYIAPMPSYLMKSVLPVSQTK